MYKTPGKVVIVLLNEFSILSIIWLKWNFEANGNLIVIVGFMARERGFFERSFMFRMIRDFFLLLVIVAVLELGLRYRNLI